ncbi:MAG: tRNA (adenosine(37)-N6)-threonylcarbamoyltransferase complex ATPase subunit type 1 TsaE [Planctomycetes bacterium SCN 63-9]|nr:MAG: tRNA (adenosine(37)-N6)-threonylcarbamoyltransferase complex ATPase subunit type 1 TsaE [Planctomycetes bacterium SCN 63-9]
MKSLDSQTDLPIHLASEEDTERLGRAIAETAPPGTVIGLVGGLGAGKTRLVRAIAESLEVDPDAISSPTFILIHEYEGRMPVYHFDVYRLKSAAEFEDLGLAEYWNGGGLCLVEWADRVPELLPRDAWTIAIDPDPDAGPTVRTVWIRPSEARAQIEGRYR